MVLLKCVLLILVFVVATYIGILSASKYKNRVVDLKEMQSALNMLETKIKFTYSPLPDIFEEISEHVNPNISHVFRMASIKMDSMNATDAWEQAIDISYTNLNKEDISTVKGLGKLLGKTDVEGQISEIELVKKFLEIQIDKAENECNKNEKLYKTLGIVSGMGIVIILI